MTKIQLGNKTRSQIYTLVLFIIVLIISALVLTAIHNQWRQDRSDDLDFLLNNEGRSIATDISRSLSGAEILAAWVTANNGNIEQFDYFATKIIGSLGGITNLQLAPDGIVKHISPLEGHEAALGHNILKDDKRSKEALLAIASAQMTLAGPFELMQGGIAIIGRKPVFLDKIDPQTGVVDPNERYFWGYASSLIILDEIMSTTKLTSLLPQGYYFQVWRYHPDTGKKQIFARNSSRVISEDSSYTIRLPNTIWHLNIEPIVKIDQNNWLVTATALLLIIDILICCFVYQLLRSPARLKDDLQRLQQQSIGDLKTIAIKKRQINKLQSIVDNSIEAILICDSYGYIKYVNRRFIEQSGYSSQEVIGQTPSLFRSAKTALQQHKQLWHEISCGKIWQGQLCNSRKNGELYWIDIKITPVKDHHGNIIEFVSTSNLSQSIPQQTEPEISLIATSGSV